MNITAVTAPTRGPDYVAPTANLGTPIVTAPQPSPAVATESPYTAIPYAADTTMEIARRKKMSSGAMNVTPSRNLAATRAAILPQLPDRPATHIPFHLAAQAYQAQRRAESEAAQTAAIATPFTVRVTEQHSSPPTSADQPMSPQPNSASTTAGGLDVIA